MAAGSNILKNFNLFIETYGYAGNIDELQLPALKIKTEEHRTGGMDAPMDIDMGMEKLEATFTLTKLDSVAMSLLGQTIKNVSVTVRGAVQDADGTVSEVVVKMTGKCTSYEPDSWKAGEKPKYKYTLSLIYYHHTQGGLLLHVIDVPNMVRMIAGVDQLAAIRTAIQGGQGITATLRNVIGV
jgi:P2 family phage contractile tail tube protein